MPNIKTVMETLRSAVLQLQELELVRAADVQRDKLDRKAGEAAVQADYPFRLMELAESTMVVAQRMLDRVEFLLKDDADANTSHTEKQSVVVCDGLLSLIDRVQTANQQQFGGAILGQEIIRLVVSGLELLNLNLIPMASAKDHMAEAIKSMDKKGMGGVA